MYVCYMLFNKYSRILDIILTQKTKGHSVERTPSSRSVVTIATSRCAYSNRNQNFANSFPVHTIITGGSVAEWLACWTQGPGSNRSRDAVG